MRYNKHTYLNNSLKNAFCYSLLLTAVKYSYILAKKTMAGLISKFVDVTSAPLDFFDFIKNQNEALYRRIAHLCVFEELSDENFQLRKLYQPGVWDENTKITLDAMWCRYCSLFP